MVLEIIVFAISLIGILALIVVRSIRLKNSSTYTEEDTISYRLESKWKNVLNKTSTSYKKRIDALKRSPSFVKRIPSHSKVYLYKRFKRSIDLLNGKGVLHNKGAMPVYFSSIKEHKEEIRNRE